MLSWIIFTPLIGAGLLLLLSRDNHKLIRSVALLTTLVDFGLTLWLYFRFDAAAVGYQFAKTPLPWIQFLNSSYYVGVDGLSLWLVLLTAFLGPLCILGSWGPIQKRVKEYHFSFLFLQTGMLGVFLSLDLVLFYVFWEVMLIPMYLLIGVWGGPNRIYAAFKFFLYTMVGSLLMLVAIIWLYVHSGPDDASRTFNLVQIAQMPHAPLQAQMWLFAAFGLAFAIKVPMFPFHTWLPDAHVEAPTAGSVILAGVLLKMGTYGFLRFCLPLFPQAAHEFTPLICTLAVVGIIYGALVSMVQPDMKKLVAYSSVSHLGFVMLGLFALNPQGVSGGIMQMLNHGVSTGALFFLVGVIYDRRHTRMIADYGGLAKVMPLYTTVFIIVALSSLGLPGLNGFVGEFLILLGAWKAHPTYAALAALGVIFAAVYLLWMIQRVFYGPLDKAENEDLADLTLREKLFLYPLVIMIIWMGVFPQMFLSKMETSVRVFLEGMPK